MDVSVADRWSGGAAGHLRRTARRRCGARVEHPSLSRWNGGHRSLSTGRASPPSADSADVAAGRMVRNYGPRDQGAARQAWTGHTHDGPRCGRGAKAPDARHVSQQCAQLVRIDLWESKQLVRNELWMALGTVDQQVKQCFLTMMEWNSSATNPSVGDTWYGGRRIEEWADPRWVTGLGEMWPCYDSGAAWDALFATLELFSRLARETAEALGHRYPEDDEVTVRSWINARRPPAVSDD